MARPGIGIAATVVQQSDLRFSRIVVDRPALIVLNHGSKIVQAAGAQWSATGGEAIAIAGGQSFDVINRLGDNGLYQARWLIWDVALIERFERTMPPMPALRNAAALGTMDAHFLHAFERAIEAVKDVEHVPDDVAAHRLTEVLVWLGTRGVRFPTGDNANLSMQVRRLVEATPEQAWTSAMMAQHLAMSQATLRRRLAAQGAAFSHLLLDVRMSSAMVLLQTTDFAVNRIALQVGYESASRFAIRFRERFGFAPTAIRGHARAGAVSALAKGES